MIKILAMSPMKADGTSFYRAYGTFKDLADKVDIEIIDYIQRPGGWSWADFAMCDILFLQRPGTPEHHKLCRYCKDMGLKVWIDYDDNFFLIPAENRMFDAITVESKQRMLDIIKMADVVSVSTEALKTFMVKAGAKRVDVIPNALNPNLLRPVKAYNFRRPKIPPNPQRQVYTWRGSDTHSGDILDYMDPLSQAMEARKDVDWVFMGWNPWYLNRVGLQYRYIHPDDIFSYFEKLKQVRPELMHVVLSANEFNLHKSNIAWIEATAAGSVCVGPAWPEWTRPGLINYDTPDQYRDILTNANDLKLADRWQESMDFIQENLLLTRVNEKRADLIESLMANNVQLPIPQSMVE